MTPLPYPEDLVALASLCGRGSDFAKTELTPQPPGLHPLLISSCLSSQGRHAHQLAFLAHRDWRGLGRTLRWALRPRAVTAILCQETPGIPFELH